MSMTDHFPSTDEAFFAVNPDSGRIVAGPNTEESLREHIKQERYQSLKWDIELRPYLECDEDEIRRYHGWRERMHDL